ncbi:MAG: sodium-translocating pyrophosphatase [Candidatus Aenigmarchaeota archaeon CG1_02_38_14]|nr:sodium-translocating pyrophosphatase [Candidatus Aenigmarchaeota archaeon]OIN85436.1 MAG: sodium-translocating pyrophosphatase [Candidatus Aenigmarchaeota archaeon CG1_02_38_14]
MLINGLAISFISAFIALGYAFYLAIGINKHKIGNKKMKDIYEAIREGSKAYLKRQYKTIIYISVVLAVLLYFAFDFSGNKFPYTSLAFTLGAICSLVAGYVGMDVATKANARTAYAGLKGINEPVQIAFRGGLVMGLFNVGMSLLGVSALFYFYDSNPHMIIGFGFGASLSALFAQLGGGIFTKAADVGADLVGKVEAGIPEDDPRNPAVIADNVGDNVGDIAGRGADLFESLTGENIGAMIVGLSLYALTKNFFFVLFPLLARSVGIFGTIFGVPFVKVKGGEDPMRGLTRGVIATTLFCIVGFYFLIRFTLHNVNLFYAGMVGLVASIVMILITEYYTSKKYKPVRDIAEASKTGHATNIITGFATGLESTALPVIVISIAILISYYFGTIFAAQANIDSFIGGIYGTAVATMGMLSIAGMVLGLDGFGPIVDNAGGIVEMSGGSSKLRKITDSLDSAGNTTKALTKGYAMASAGLAALLLFQAYLEVTKITVVDIVVPKIIVGLFIGCLLPFIFASFAIRAVGKAAFKMVEEVRRQFKEIPGIMTGKAKPDYSKCIEISTVAAQKEMILPGLIPIAVPILIGFTLGAEAVGALLIGATLTGFILAMMMNTGGAAWDNAKKYIEDGFLGGKGSEAHKAAVTGDTVGDPFKDTAGPSLHVLVKLLNTICLTFGMLFVLHALL